MPRTKKQRASEGGGGFDLPGGESFTVVPVGFMHRWKDLDGDGKKQDTGRLWLGAYEKKYKSEEAFERWDPYRFHVTALLLVVMGPEAGKTGNLGLALQDLHVDDYGQSWTVDYRADRDTRSAFARFLDACGLALDPGQLAGWQGIVAEHIEQVTEKHPYLLGPVPTKEEVDRYNKRIVASHGLEDAADLMIGQETFPAWSRELILMGLEKVLLDELPVLVAKTKAGGKVFDYESVQAQTAELVPTIRAGFSEDVVGVIKARRALRDNLFCVPLEDAMPGMPWREKVDEPTEYGLTHIPFMPDEVAGVEKTPDQIVAIAAMWDVIRRAYAEGDKQKEIAERLFKAGVIPGQDTLEKLTYKEAVHVYADLAEAHPYLMTVEPAELAAMTEAVPLQGAVDRLLGQAKEQPPEPEEL